MGVLLPMTIGIAAGITISGFGFALGLLIVTLWRMMFRKTGGGDVEEALEDEEDEKKELLVGEETVIQEEALPLYQEKE